MDIGESDWRAYTDAMPRTQQTFVNDKNEPIYVSVEPWPECFELEPGERLTLIYEAPTDGDAVQINFVNNRELNLWPNAVSDNITFLINGEPGEDRSWRFRHKYPE